MRNSNLAWIALAFWMAHTGFAAQRQPDSDPSATFEVASVKQVKNNDGRLTFNFYPGRVELLATLRTIIEIAYDIRDFQLVGGPSWIHTDYFEIIATKPGKTVAETRALLQSLLADRFKLAIHRETKTAPAFALVMARADKAKHPQLRESAVDCAALGPTPPAVHPREKSWCGIRGTGPGRMTGQGATMAVLARFLTQGAGRLVIDETGLPGGYDFEFVWFRPKTADDPTPPLPTVLEDQLGLKLTSTERAVEFVIIDRVEQPSPN